MKRLYLVRHGQTVGNLGKYFQFPETELSEAGLHGARAVAERFKNVAVDQIFASHYTRTQQTAEYIGKVIDISVETLESLHERNHQRSMLGVEYDSEQGSVYTAQQREAYWTADWKEDGAENIYDILERVKECIDVFESSVHNHIIAVSHANFIKTLATHILMGKGEDVAMHRMVYNGIEKMSNVGISEFVYDEGRWRMLHWNDHAHFAE